MTKGVDLAIVGMACRFPAARTKEEFWDNLLHGREAIIPLSEQELLSAGVARHQLDSKTYVRSTALLDDIDKFDARFFGMRPQEARLIDPQQRLLLEVAYEALEDAGHVNGASQCQVGVYATGGGVTTSYLMHHHVAAFENIPHGTGSAIHIGNDKDFLATQLSFRLNLSGPSMTVQTACSSSIVALHLARTALMVGEIDMALVAASCVRVPQLVGYEASEAPIVSPTGKCRPFSSDADGTVFGSGVGAVLVKRYEDALRDGDHIYALVKSTAVNNDGSAKVGFTASSVPGQAKAMIRALDAACVGAQKLNYVECHGTATKIGDPLEIKALEKVFRMFTDERHFCGIGSVKSNIGHLEQAAGIASLIKVALMLKHRRFVPSINYHAPNPKIKFEESPFYVVNKAARWENRNEDGASPVYIAGLNCLGIGGTNAFAVLAEAPPRPTGAEKAGSTAMASQLICLSAKNRNQLAAYLERFAQFTADTPEIIREHMCYTVNVSRSQHRVRFCGLIDERTDLPKFFRDGAYEAEANDRALPPMPQLTYVCNPDVLMDDTTIGEWLSDTRMMVLRERFEVFFTSLEPNAPSGNMRNALALGIYRTLAFELALCEQLVAWGIRFGRIVGIGIGCYVAHLWERKEWSLESLALLHNDIENYIARTSSDDQHSLPPTLSLPEHDMTTIGNGQSFPIYRALPDDFRKNDDVKIADSLSLAPHRHSISVTDLLTFLTRYLKRGGELDWQAYYASMPMRRVSLPTYPFAAESHWIGDSPSRQIGISGEDMNVNHGIDNASCVKHNEHIKP